MSTNQIAGSFVALRGENCNLTNVGGVKSLVTDTGLDLVTVGSRLEHSLATMELKVQELTKQLADLSVNVGKSGEDGVDGRDGLQGPAGPAGPAGPVGPRGPRGKVEKIQDIGDVDLDGLEEGAILEWSASRKKWVVSLP